MTDDDRVTALEDRVAALESVLGRASRPPADDRADAAGDGTGTVGYRGRVALHGRVEWRIDYAAGATAALPAHRLAAVLGALGHPARVEIVQELLRGPRTAVELLDHVDAGSKGQLYHHLTTLAAAGIVDKAARGSYSVAPQKVVPALTAMLAAADIDGLLR